QHFVFITAGRCRVSRYTFIGTARRGSNGRPTLYRVGFDGRRFCLPGDGLRAGALHGYHRCSLGARGGGSAGLRWISRPTKDASAVDLNNGFYAPLVSRPPAGKVQNRSVARFIVSIHPVKAQQPVKADAMLLTDSPHRFISAYLMVIFFSTTALLFREIVFACDKPLAFGEVRSEERRVGKECGDRGGVDRV